MNKPNVPKKPIRAGFLADIEMPTMVPAPDNMKAEKTADMTFRMDPKWHSRFKATAALHGMSMKELLVESFALWEQSKKGKS